MLPVIRWILLVFPVFVCTSCDDDVKPVGILAEHCEDEHLALMGLKNVLKESAVQTRYWKVECHGYITMANHMAEVNETGVTRLILIARREMLRFAESLLESSNIQESTSIPTNNQLMVTGLSQSKLQRKSCNDRAGGKQFWGLLSALLPDIIDKWQWRNLYLYVDEIFGLTEAKQIYIAFQPYQRVASLKLIQTTKTSQPIDFLKRLAIFDRGVREVKAVIVVCGHQITKDIVAEASKMQLFSTFYRWLMFDNGSDDLLRLLKLQFDTDVIMMRHLGGKTPTSSALQSLEKYMVVSEDKPKQNTPNFKKPVQSQCYSDSYLTDSKFLGNRSKISGREHLPQDLTLEFLRVKRSSGLALPKLDPIGQWTVGNGFAKGIQQMYDFDGFTLQIVAINCPPYVFVTRNLEGQYFFRGYLIDVIDGLAKIMNFKYNITVPFDHTYGRCEGKLCSGLIGVLVRREADLALANLTPTGSRVKLMDFSAASIDKGGLSVLIRRPTKTDSNVIKAYIMPFSMDVSLCVAAAIPLFGFMLYMVLKVGANIRHGTDEEEIQMVDPQAVKDNRSVGRCLFAAMQSFGQQGIDIVPTSASGRAIFGLMWLFSLFIMSAYTANLISYFTASFVSYPFKRLEDAFESGYYKFGFIKGTTYLDDIQGDNKTLMMKIWKKIEKQRFTTLVDDLDEGLERVRTERYLLIHENRVLQYITGKDCEFDIINEKYLSAPMMLAFQKNSQFRWPISLMLLKMSESGLLERLKNRWWPPTFDCSLANQTFSSISLFGMASILAILGFGIVFGLLFLLTEKGVAAQKLRNRLKALTETLPENIPNIRIPLSSRLRLHLPSFN